MPQYHFSLGDSSKGPVGFCAIIVADSPEAAVARLREKLPEELMPDDTDDEYIAVYFNPDAITVADIDEVEGDEVDSDGAIDANGEDLRPGDEVRMDDTGKWRTVSGVARIITAPEGSKMVLPQIQLAFEDGDDRLFVLPKQGVRTRRPK